MLPPANTVEIDSKTSCKHNSWWDYDFSKQMRMSFNELKNKQKTCLNKL